MKPTKMIMILIIALMSALLVSCDEPGGKKAAIYAWFPSGNVIQISPSKGIFYQACVHPEGTHVLCSGNTTGAPHIWKADLEKITMDDLGPEGAASIHGVFSWDGSKIAFASDLKSPKPSSFDVGDIDKGGTPPAGAKLNIFIMDADGNHLRQLTGGTYQDQRPAFSPLGDYIVFVRYTGLNKPMLWMVSTKGNGINVPVPISGTQKAYRPWFSKNGKILYFFTFNTPYSRHQIASMPIDLKDTPPKYGTIAPLAQDDEGLSHGPSVVPVADPDPDPNNDYLLMHSTREGGAFRIYGIQLPDGKPELLQPPGFENIPAGHATMSIDGVMTFDAEPGVLGD